MQQSMAGNQMQLNLAGPRRALADVLTLSEQQALLRSRLQNLAPDSPPPRALAQDAVELSEGPSVVSDSPQELAGQIPQLSRGVQQLAADALREMARSTEGVAERQQGQAGAHQQSAMMNLNELAYLLSELMSNMMSGQQSGGSMSMQ